MVAVRTVQDNLRRTGELPDSDSARLDLEVLLAHVLQQTRTWLYTWPEKTLTPTQQQSFDDLLRQRAQGVPVAHLTGRREFWSLDLKVDASTLIPRPETELLVEVALELCTRPGAQVLDLGTGTGAIALALASERPDWRVCALEKSAQAVALAEENRSALGLANVDVQQSDWFECLDPQATFDLIVSNPPYIDIADPHLHEGDVRFEPQSALVAAHDGLADIEQIAAGAMHRLVHNGWLVVEHGWQQAAAVQQIFRAVGLREVSSRHDYGDRERLTLGRR